MAYKNNSALDSHTMTERGIYLNKIHVWRYFDAYIYKYIKGFYAVLNLRQCAWSNKTKTNEYKQLLGFVADCLLG